MIIECQALKAIITDKLSSVPKEDLIEEIVQDISREEIEDARQTVFCQALGCYKEQLHARDIFVTPDISLKKRRGAVGKKRIYQQS